MTDEPGDGVARGSDARDATWVALGRLADEVAALRTDATALRVTVAEALLETRARLHALERRVGQLEASAAAQRSPETAPKEKRRPAASSARARKTTA